MKTVRIPLISFTITNLGAQNVDLTDIDSITFEFDAKATGEIEFSDYRVHAIMRGGEPWPHCENCC